MSSRGLIARACRSKFAERLPVATRHLAAVVSFVRSYKRYNRQNTHTQERELGAPPSSVLRDQLSRLRAHLPGACELCLPAGPTCLK